MRKSWPKGSKMALFTISLATLDRLMAKQCDVVLEAVYTQIIVHKGSDVFRKGDGETI